jgi:hypothetical protein
VYRSAFDRNALVRNTPGKALLFIVMLFSMLAANLLGANLPGVRLAGADAAAAQPIDKGSVDLYVFAGQSNMRGKVALYTNGSNGPSLIPEPYKTSFAAPVAWARQWNNGVANPSAGLDATNNAFGSAFVAFHAGYDANTKKLGPWGPEVAFLQQRYLADPRPLHFVKYAIGNTALYYRPTLVNWNVQASGNTALLPALEERVRRAAAALLADGYSHVEIRLIWAQGEADTGTLGHTYLVAFTDMFNHFAASLTTSTTSVRLETITLIANAITANTQARINIAASHFAGQVVNVRSYPTALFLSDKLHLGPEGQIRHGEDMERLSRTLPRSPVAVPGGSLGLLTIGLPTRPGVIIGVSTTADGTRGLELFGDASGLALDPLKGTLSVVDPSLLTVGVRELIIRQHSATEVTDRPLRVTFTN